MKSWVSRFKDIEKDSSNGSYGTIRYAVDRETGIAVALKFMSQTEYENGLPHYLLREISILKELNHPNIVPVLDIIDTEKNFVIVMPRFTKNLYSFVRSHGVLNIRLLQSYAFQLLAGLHYIHSHRIIHRDIKTLNILLDPDGRLVIADFGMARHYSIPLQQYTPEVASLLYRAPELLGEPKMYSTAVDMWAAGCCIAEMAIGCPLFSHADSPVQLVHSIMAYHPDDECPEDLRRYMCGTAHPKTPLIDTLVIKDEMLCDLISSLLQLDPTKRLSAKEALEHPFFDDISTVIRKRCLANLI